MTSLTFRSIYVQLHKSRTLKAKFKIWITAVAPLYRCFLLEREFCAQLFLLLFWNRIQNGNLWQKCNGFPKHSFRQETAKEWLNSKEEPSNNSKGREAVTFYKKIEWSCCHFSHSITNTFFCSDVIWQVCVNSVNLGMMEEYRLFNTSYCKGRIWVLYTWKVGGVQEWVYRVSNIIYFWQPCMLFPIFALWLPRL